MKSLGLVLFLIQMFSLKWGLKIIPCFPESHRIGLCCSYGKTNGEEQKWCIREGGSEEKRRGHELCQPPSATVERTGVSNANLKMKMNEREESLGSESSKTERREYTQEGALSNWT